MERFLIDGIEVDKNEFDAELEEAVRNEVEMSYDEILDESYEAVKIGRCTFNASDILKKLDPIAYNCGIDDYVSAQLEDYSYELERYGSVNIDNFEFEIIEEENEEEAEA